MRDKRKFVRSWYAWIRLDRPTGSWETGHRRAPGYDTECEIDHIISSVAGTGRAFLSGEPFDFVWRAESVIEDIDELLERIAATDLRVEQRTRYIELLEASRRLLAIIAECAASSPPPAAPGA